MRIEVVLVLIDRPDLIEMGETERFGKEEEKAVTH